MYHLILSPVGYAFDGDISRSVWLLGNLSHASQIKKQPGGPLLICNREQPFVYSDVSDRDTGISGWIRWALSGTHHW